MLKTLQKLPALGFEEIVDFKVDEKQIRAKYNDLVTVLKKHWGHYLDYTTGTRIYEKGIIEVLGEYFSSNEIWQIFTNNYHYYGNYYDNRFQSNLFINELKTLAQTTEEPQDKRDLQELLAALEAFKKEKEPAKKESFGRRLLGKIKKLGTTARDEAVKETIKKAFPEIIDAANDGINWVSTLDFEGIMQALGGNL